MPELIDQRIAAAIARRLAGDGDGGNTYLEQRLERDLEVGVSRAEELVASTSGIPAPSPVRWAIVRRSAWAEANVVDLIMPVGSDATEYLPPHQQSELVEMLGTEQLKNLLDVLKPFLSSP